MIRTICQRLIQLLCSLLGRGGSDDPDNQADQDAEQETAESGSDDDERNGDGPDRPGGDGGDGSGGDGDGQGGDGEDDEDDDGGGGGASVDADADADVEAEAEADADHGGNTDAEADTDADVDADADDGEDVSPNHSSDEQIEMSWPRRVPEPWPDRPDPPENTIEVQLYHNDPDMGLQACRHVAPHLEWALLDAWADRFGMDADVTVRAEPVGDEAADPSYFDNWIWEDAVSMAKDANMLIVDDGGGGGAGGYSGFVKGPSYFRGFGHDPDETDEDGNPAVIPYGGGEARLGVNRVIHEVLHCLGISHNGRFSEFEFVDWYGQSYLPPLWTTYRDASRYTIRLCEANRTVRPTVQ